jgi:hypothetical protein
VGEKDTPQFLMKEQAARGAISRIAARQTQQGQLLTHSMNQRQRSKLDCRERQSRFPRPLRLLHATQLAPSHCAEGPAKKAAHRGLEKKKAEISK